MLHYAAHLVLSVFPARSCRESEPGRETEIIPRTYRRVMENHFRKCIKRSSTARGTIMEIARRRFPDNEFRINRWKEIAKFRNDFEDEQGSVRAYVSSTLSR